MLSGALSASKQALWIPRHTRVRTRVASYARRAITEGVGVATVTNTTQPLRRPRQKHLQCLLKTLQEKNTAQKHPVKVPNSEKTERSDGVQSRARARGAESVSASSET